MDEPLNLRRMPCKVAYRFHKKNVNVVIQDCCKNPLKDGYCMQSGSMLIVGTARAPGFAQGMTRASLSDSGWIAILLYENGKASYMTKMKGGLMPAVQNSIT